MHRAVRESKVPKVQGHGSKEERAHSHDRIRAAGTCDNVRASRVLRGWLVRKSGAFRVWERRPRKGRIGCERDGGFACARGDRAGGSYAVSKGIAGSVLNFPGASREMTILELFSEWDGKPKKWDGKLELSFFARNRPSFIRNGLLTSSRRAQIDPF